MEPYVEYTRSCAYHEAAHAVAAAVQGMPLTEKGVHLDRWGNGITYYRFRKPDGSVNVGREGEREKTIIVAFAGWIAQRKVYPCPGSGAHCDIDHINALLSEMYPDGSPTWWQTRANLFAESQRFVERHWNAIESLALALWSKPEIPMIPQTQAWSTEPVEKCLTANEVVGILQGFGISACIERTELTPK